MPLVPPSSKYGNASVVLGALATGWSHTGDTAETLLASVAIPANTVGVGGQLEIVTLWTVTNSVNNKVIAVRFGAANDLTGTLYLQSTVTAVTSQQSYARVANRLTNSQIGWTRLNPTGFGNQANAAATSAIDTTAQTFVVFTGTLASAGETVTLESYVVRLSPGV